MSRNTEKEIRKVGLAMAAYQPNRSAFLEQLRSLQRQTFTNWHCSICFDSPIIDIINSPEIAEILSDTRFTYVENSSRLGVTENFFAALRLTLINASDMDAFGFVDQDDIWYPNKLSNSIDALTHLPPNSCVHVNSNVIFDSQSMSTSKTTWEYEERNVHLNQLDHLLVRNVAAGAGMLMDKSLPLQHSHFPVGFTEYDWWFSIVSQSLGGLYAIEEPQYDYRQHANNTLGATRYAGFFTSTEKDRKEGKYKKLRRIFVDMSSRLDVMNQKDIKPSRYMSFAASKRFLDFGLLLSVRSLTLVMVDRPLARAYLTRAVGKLLYQSESLLSRFTRKNYPHATN